MTRRLVVDGVFEDGTFQGDGQDPPFVIFDVDNQRNLPGEYPTRQRAEAAMTEMLKEEA
jgi:hypothetical protein